CGLNQTQNYLNCGNHEQNPEYNPDFTCPPFVCVIFRHNCSLIRLNQIEKGKDKDPNQIHKMPVQTDLLNHFVGSTAFVSAQHYIVENDEVDDHSREYVEAVESCDEEKEIGKLRVAVF